MRTIERMMRVMTHLNIGTALGMVLWVGWSGLQIVNGNVPAQRIERPDATATPAPRGAVPKDPAHTPCDCLAPSPGKDDARAVPLDAQALVVPGAGDARGMST